MNDLTITVSARSINEAARRLEHFVPKGDGEEPSVPTLDAALRHWLQLVAEHILDAPEAYTRSSFYGEWEHALECAMPERQP